MVFYKNWDERLGPERVAFGKTDSEGVGLNIDETTPPTPPPSPEAIGTIYTESLATLTDWDQTGAEFTEVETGVQASAAGFTDFNRYILFNETGNAHRFTCLEKFQIQFTINSSTTGNANSFGVGVGIHSTNTTDARYLIARLAMDPGVEGRMYLYEEKNLTPVQVVGTGYDFAQNTDYVIQLELDQLTLEMRGYDATGETLLFTNTYNYSINNANFLLPNTGRFAFWSFGGTHIIKNWTISTTTKKNIDYVLLGDSIGRGYFASSLANIWWEEYMANNLSLTYENLSGWGDKAYLDVESRIAEVAALNPSNVVISLLSNDIGTGTDQTQRRNAYNALISYLEARGINVILTTIVPRNDVNVSVEQAFITGKSNVVIDLYTALKGAGTGLNAAYDGGDGIHMNDAGHGEAAITAQTDNPI